MVTERLEVRLDRERRRKLSELAQGQGAALSEVVRRLIDQAYDEARHEERIRAAEHLISLEVEDVPDPETLSRQLDSTHDLPDLP